MSENQPYDLVAIGGGPAGYAAAIRAAQLGARVACVEMERAGGTCLNWGCIPTKALLTAAETVQTIRDAAQFGIASGPVEIDFAQVMARSRKVADQMGRGIEFLFRKNKVEYLVGRAHIPAPGLVEITEGRDAQRFLSARHILVATGCKARRLTGVTVDGERILTSREALAMKQRPASIVILGAGAIGVEFAYFLRTMGCAVTIVEMLPRLLPIEDEEISAALARSFKKQGIAVRTGAKVEKVIPGAGQVAIELLVDGRVERLEAGGLLVAIGVEPNLEGLFSPRVKPDLHRGYLKVDDRYQTTIGGIYAAGDIIGPPWLAHVATFEAIQAVHGILGHGQPRRVKIYPGCTYCQPQVASVGLTEQAAKEKGLAYKIGKFPFTASGKAVAANAAEGFVKVLLGDPHGEVLGAHIIGHNATELIAEYVLAMQSELTAEDIHGTIHAHPTMSEALAEAVASATNEAIHI